MSCVRCDDGSIEPTQIAYHRNNVNHCIHHVLTIDMNVIMFIVHVFRLHAKHFECNSIRQYLLLESPHSLNPITDSLAQLVSILMLNISHAGWNRRNERIFWNINNFPNSPPDWVKCVHSPLLEYNKIVWFINISEEQARMADFTMTFAIASGLLNF